MIDYIRNGHSRQEFSDEPASRSAVRVLPGDGQESDTSVGSSVHPTLSRRPRGRGVPMRFARHWRRSTVPAALLIVFASATYESASAQQPATSPGATKQLQPADLKTWKSIRQAALSNDGAWFAYVVAPNEGDASLVIRS